MILLSVACFLLAWSLRILGWTARVSTSGTYRLVKATSSAVNKQTASLSEKNRQVAEMIGSVATSAAKLGKVMGKFTQRLLDVLSILLLSSSILVSTLALLAVVILGGGIISVLYAQDPSQFQFAAGGSSSSSSSSSQQQNQYSAGEGVPPVATNPADIPAAMIAAAEYGMKQGIGKKIEPPAGETHQTIAFGYSQENMHPSPYVHDCSSAMTMLLETAGWVKKPSGPGIQKTPPEWKRLVFGVDSRAAMYTVNKVDNKDGKTAVHGWVTREATGGMMATYAPYALKPDEPHQPGDIMVNGGHTQMYVGNINGKEVIFNFGSETRGPMFIDKELTQKSESPSYVGFMPFNDRSSYTWYRLSKAEG